jgi:hypothetical protein
MSNYFHIGRFSGTLFVGRKSLSSSPKDRPKCSSSRPAYWREKQFWKMKNAFVSPHTICAVLGAAREAHLTMTTEHHLCLEILPRDMGFSTAGQTHDSALLRESLLEILLHADSESHFGCTAQGRTPSLQSLLRISSLRKVAQDSPGLWMQSEEGVG